MSFSGVRRILVAVAIFGGLLTIPAVQVQAATTGPTVIAVHRDGAVDVSGNGTFGTVAKMSVPAGNWSISASATIIGTDATSQDECQLVAGNEFYKTRTNPTAQGPGSSQAVVLLVVHHFAKTGTITLKCYSNGWTGDLLIRDVHVAAIKVGRLVDDSNTTVNGTGTPQAYFTQDTNLRQYLDTNQYGVDDLYVDVPGTWLVRATLWGTGNIAHPRVDCSLVAGTTTIDQSFENFGYSDPRTISLEGVFTSPGAWDFEIVCNDESGGWIVDGSAISAIQVGTLKYGAIGGSATTTGSGSPTVVGGYGGPGGITDATSPASIGSVSLGAGSWDVTSKLSVATGAGTSKVTCRLKVSGGSSQDRVILDTSNNQYNWMPMSLTRKLTAASNASVPCNQSAGSLGAFYYDLKIFALKAGTLTDTALN